ncbi:Gfo/Idh/MocA family protein [Bacillus sp. 03113]|uniref:Gfo/Idh/MocA family protein n=1 Tax=Bacillus sp. 03113 TaxID=2578211 RepID=UPI001143D6E2|nr:Gfo/Idh/MocA family oxidoreductase [Bacillus sp. 03113]
MKRVRVGVVGCGNISDIYLENCAKFDHLEMVTCADLNMELAKEKADKYNIPNVFSVEKLLSDSRIDLVVNLTPPSVHAEVCLCALNSGKHVYTEKPLAVLLEDGKRIVDTAREKGLLVGAAPDTFLGAGIQTCQWLLQNGEIGEPVAATAFMMKAGPEQWHPNPEFFYQVGGGPLFDMGPYYLTVLTQLLGPIKRVAASVNTSFNERIIQVGEKKGKKINVKTPTHLAGTLDFENGAIATMITSFDVVATRLPFIEVYGTEGTLGVPDPNRFEGPVWLRKKGEENWSEIPLISGSVENSRGIGVADMASSILYGTPFRANGERAFHVLEAMHAFQKSSLSNKHYQLQSTCQPSPLLSNNLNFGLSFA